MKRAESKKTPSSKENDSIFLEIDSKKSKLIENLKIVSDRRDGAPQIHKLAESSVLGRVKGFLPMISKANEDLNVELSKGNGQKFDIENVEEAENVIEMDLSVIPNSCDGASLPSSIKELLDPDESVDSDSSEEEPETQSKVEKNLIEEV